MTMMSDGVIHINIEDCHMSQRPIHVTMQSGSNNGINWECKADTCMSVAAGRIEEFVYFKWIFEWEELAKQGIAGFNGSAELVDKNYSAPFKETLYFELSDSRRTVQKRAWLVADSSYTHRMYFYLTLTPVRSFSEKSPYEEMFQQTDITDVELTIEGQKIYANKGLLMSHSKVFHETFISKFKEKTMTEVHIRGVRYEDFAHFLSVIHSNPELPTDSTATRLLELADRFKMFSVIRHVEERLFHTTALPFTEVLMLADRFHMNTLAERYLSLIKSYMMTEESIDFKSESFHVNPSQKDKLMSKGSQNGLSWECNFAVGMAMSNVTLDECVYLNWKFEWDEQKMKEIAGYRGQLHLYQGFNRINKLTFPIELSESGQIIEKKADLVENIGMLRAKFELNLVPVRSFTENSPYEEMFQETEITDVALIVEEKKIYVNKGLLMVYSKFFHKLFNSDIKEIATGEMTVDNVRYDDFARLLSIINPRPAFPTDDTAPILLKLADRFEMPAVTSHVEQRILLGTDIQFSRILLLADQYKMEKLLEKCIKLITSSLHVKSIRKSPFYDGLTDSTKFVLFDLICSFP